MLARVTALGPDDREILVAAAWLHDIGYAPGLAETGFHPLDGARWLRTAGFGDRLAGLVAYHSCAVFEAEERGLVAVLRSEFRDEEGDLRDALWYADLTTGPDGQPMTVCERLAEIRDRYGPDSVVTRTWDRAEPHVLAMATSVEAAMATSPTSAKRSGSSSARPR